MFERCFNALERTPKPLMRPVGFGERGRGLWVMLFPMLVGICGPVVSPSQVPEIVKDAWESVTVDTYLGNV